MKPRVRIDRLLVDKGLAESRQKAQALIMAGQVLAEEQKVDKPGQLVAPGADIRLIGLPEKYVSRAGLKLEAALERFSIDVSGKVCLDVGASTGGFTDCLLQNGALKVYAVDVGSGQLHWKLRQDPSVIVLERVNARYLSKDHVPEPVAFVCCDVSFISVTLILPALMPLFEEKGAIVVLAKPQFEVGKGQVGKGGIVSDPALHRQVIEKIAATIRASGFGRVEHMESPILGAEGNQEFLLWGSELTRSHD